MSSWSIQALGWAGSALLIFSLLQQRVLRFRLLNLTASCTLIVFNAMLHVWPMVGMNTVTAGINIWMVTKLLRERGDESVYEVVAVGADESYLQHFLKVQGADIRRHFPKFDLGLLAEALVVTVDEHQPASGERRHVRDGVGQAHDPEDRRQPA